MVKSPCRKCGDWFPNCYKVCKRLHEVQTFSISRRKDVLDTGVDPTEEYNMPEID